MGLVVKSLSTGYVETQVLWGIDLECQDKSLTAIIGPNGAGKSTTLRAVSGQVRTWRGKIMYNGEDITDLPAYSRTHKGIASSPEGRRLFPLLTTEENLKLGSYSSRARELASETAASVYALFPRLKERAKVRAGQLSGGEQQMLAIGRALMARPTLLLLDEPSLGLAPKLIGEIFEKIQELRSEGLSILMVEQNAYQALRIADFAYVMQMGKIVNQGTPSKLMDLEELRKSYFGA